MHCRSCDYELWNLEARACPECGNTFAVSSYEFAPDSVRFCCPHCGHPYFGTNEKGHPEPRAFACLRCGRPIDLDEMIVRPGLGVAEAQAAVSRMPWLEARGWPRIRAWFGTIGLALTAPRRLIRAVPLESSLPDAWRFGFVTCALIYLVGVGPYALWMGALGGVGMALTSWNVAAVYLAYLCGALLAPIVVVAVWIVVAHVVLRMTGGAPSGVRRTAQALLYSSGANVMSAVPCCGAYFGWIWWVVSAIAMVAEGQPVSKVRAAAAVLPVPLLAVAAPIGFYAWIMVMGMASAAGGGWGGAAQSTGHLNNQLLWYASTNAGAGPDHALALYVTGAMSGFPPSGSGGGAFLDPSSDTTAGDVPVADGDLAAFETAGRSEQLRLLQQELDLLPDKVIAHRVGDHIFTYHGANLTLSAVGPAFWVVVMLPDPDSNPPPSADTPCLVGTADYSVTAHTVAELPELLAAQNELRATLNLPPLPDLTTIRHRRPAEAP